MEHKAESRDWLCSIAEVCERLRVSRVSLWRLVQRGELSPPIKIGSRALYHIRTIDAYLASKEGEAA